MLGNFKMGRIALKTYPLPSIKSAIPGNEVSNMIALPYPSLLGTTLGIGKEAARKSNAPQTRALFEKAKASSGKLRLKTF